MISKLKVNKNIFLISIISLVGINTPVWAQTQKPKVFPSKTTARSTPLKGQIQQAISNLKNGNYTQAAIQLQSLTKRSSLAQERSQLKLYLGEALMQLGYNQTAAFQFIDIIKSNDGRYTKSALERLLIVTDRLGDETLLNYAIQRIDVANVPNRYRDMLFFRMGEIKMANRSFGEASALFEKVDSKSRYYFSAVYNKGLSEAEAGQTALAIETFKKLLSSRDNAKVTDTNKVAAQLAIARTLYQAKDFEQSIDQYAKIPRDHPLWHDALFERSWAMLRTARFRSALSNFQSLHSSYYEDFYIPESLLLRSIVYLYICKYDEMEKVIGLYDKQYGPVLGEIQKFISTKKLSEDYYNDVGKAYVMQRNENVQNKTILPLKVLNKISQEGDIRRSFNYIKKLVEEKRAIEENIPYRNAAIGAYSLKLINNRVKGAKNANGDMVKAHLENMIIELKDLQEQASLIRYEMINGQKESLKKKLADKNLSDVQVDENQDRSFYIQNGYEYYPFQGEYWLDEIGNYHYLGKQSCE